MQWIDIYNEMPEVDEDVLLCVRNVQGDCWADIGRICQENKPRKSKWYGNNDIYDNDRDSGNKVTHWLHITLPEIGKNDDA